jgi:glutathione S-transferase
MENKSDWHMALSKGLLPVLEFPDSEFLVSSKMIMEWVFREAKPTFTEENDFVPENQEQFLSISAAMNNYNDLVKPIYRLLVNKARLDCDAIVAFIHAELPKHEAEAKAGKPFLHGSEAMTLVDLQVAPFWELLYMLKFHPDASMWNLLNLATNAPHLHAYIEMFRELEVVKPYRMDEQIARSYWTRAASSRKETCELSTGDYSSQKLQTIENIPDPPKPKISLEVDADEDSSEMSSYLCKYL